MPRSSMPLPQLIPNRLEKLKNRLKGLLWESLEELVLFAGKESSGDFTDISTAKGQVFKPIEPGNYFGQVSWSNRWFKLTIPAAQRGQEGRRYLIWQLNGESTVYYNDEPWCGLDLAHPECPLPDQGGDLYIDTGLYQTGIWAAPKFDCLPEPDSIGYQYTKVQLGLRNELAWKVYHDFWVLQLTMTEGIKKYGGPQPGQFGHMPKEESIPLYLRKLTLALDIVADKFDKEGLTAASDELDQVYKNFPSTQYDGKASFCGHAHMDLVWMWPESVTNRKTIHTYSTVLQLMDKYPEFIFQMSQPYILNEIKKNSPQLHTKILKRIQEKRWDATGGFEVESDTMMPVGEALLRCLEYGQQRFKEIRGSYTDTLWIPDVFGYSQSLPQICALGGIKNFFTQKMTWSAITKFPHSSFTWQGADGTSVLTHLNSTGYNANAEPAETHAAMANYQQADVHDEILIPAGYGDGAGGPTAGVIERVRRMKNLVNTPKAEWTTVDQFFDRLRAVEEDLPVYRGELYLEYHRGTLTTQSNFKYFYRRAERALQVYEAACALNDIKPDCKDAWLRVCFMQFHDAIPGSSIALVYEETNPELKAIGDKYFALAQKVLSNDSRSTITNPLAISTQQIIEIDAPKGTKSLSLSNSKTYPVQATSDKYIAAVQLSALSSSELIFSQNAVENCIEVTETKLSNGIVLAELNNHGQLSKLTVKGQEININGTTSFKLHADHPAQFDAWDMDHSINWLSSPTLDKLDFKVIEKGPARGIIQASAKISKDSTAHIDYIVEAGSEYLKIKVNIDWHEDHKHLRYEIPTTYIDRDARYGDPFGSIERPQRPGLTHEESQWEVCGSRWMALTDSLNEGLAIISEAKYGFGCHNGTAHISLLRSPYTSDNDSSFRTNILADQGKHEIEFSLGSFHATSSEENISTASAAEAIYTPFIAHNGKAPKTPFKMEGLKSIVPSWFKGNNENNGYLLRFHETMGAYGIFTVKSAEPIRKASVVNLFDETIQEVNLLDEYTIKVPYRGYQIISLRTESM